MRANLFIKFIGKNPTNDSDVELATLGRSIIGFDTAIRGLADISKIDADVEVCATKVSKGSLIVDTVIFLNNLNEHCPFSTPNDLLNFLKVAGAESYRAAELFFNGISGAHKTVNDFVAQYPLDSALISYVFSKLWKKVSVHKRIPDLDDDLPKEYAVGLNKMVRRKKFKEALIPLVEAQVSEISVSDKRDFPKETTARVDSNTIGDYLGEDEIIWPDYEDGKTYQFTGKIVAMQCSRGDSMKMRILGFDKRQRDVVAFPPDGKTTGDLDKYYAQVVRVNAVVQRDSLYQKPHLKIIDVCLQQEPLPI